MIDFPNDRLFDNQSKSKSIVRLFDNQSKWSTINERMFDNQSSMIDCPTMNQNRLFDCSTIDHLQHVCRLGICAVNFHCIIMPFLSIRVQQK
jgi:hypothetical protein